MRERGVAKSQTIPDGPTEVAVDYAPGAPILVRRLFLRGMNYFDERYGDYWPDLELCWQLRNAGKSILVLPQVRVRYGTPAPVQRDTVHAADCTLGAAAYLGKHFGSGAGLKFRMSAVFGHSYAHNSHGCRRWCPDRRSMGLTSRRSGVQSPQQESHKVTDWDRYYQAVPVTAHLTRKYTTAALVSAIESYAHGITKGISIIEVGGANSCFVAAILAQIKPCSYDVIDTNAYGLSLLAKRYGPNSVVRLHQENVLALPPSFCKADVVFSVGLIEHFDPQETHQAVRAHFDLVRPGGLVIITFPTPTILYRTARASLEALGLWKFPDERPLEGEEVRAAVAPYGEILHDRILWPLILTQQLSSRARCKNSGISIRRIEL